MSIKLKILYKLVLIFSALVLGCAYIIEYIMEYPICLLCVYQRFPYLILIFLSIISTATTNDKFDQLNRYYIITLVFAIILAIYHTGIERGVFTMSSFCKPLVKINDQMSVADFTKMIYSSKEMGQCNKPELKVLNLSLTEWNLLINIFLLVIFMKNICIWHKYCSK